MLIPSLASTTSPPPSWIPWQPNWQRMLDNALCLEGKGNLYVIADSHLGCSQAPVKPFIHMLSQLNNPAAILLLGDIFHVWLAPPRFWDYQIKQVMQALQQLRNKGTRIWCVVGNRDLLMPPQTTSWLPFDALTHQMLLVRWHNIDYGFSHGDLVNRYDNQYLFFRWLMRSRLIRGAFHLTPSPLAKKITRQLEKAAAQSNIAFKLQLPQQELQTFAEFMLPYIQNLILGHFHISKTISYQQHTLHLAPCWMKQQYLGIISHNQPPRWFQFPHQTSPKRPPPKD